MALAIFHTFSMFYICKCVDGFLSQSYITEYAVVFCTIYIQVSGSLHQSYVIRYVKSCLHFYENSMFTFYQITTNCLRIVFAGKQLKTMIY